MKEGKQLLEVKTLDNGVVVRFFGDCIETPEQLKERDKRLAAIGRRIYLKQCEMT